MVRQSGSKLTLFLMELLLVVLFFSICAAICVSVFGNANGLAQKSNDMNHAAVELKNAANCFKAAEGDFTVTADLLEVTSTEQRIVIGYDKKWKKTTEADAWHCLLELEPVGIAGEALLTMRYPDGTVLSSIQIRAHKEVHRDAD